MATREMLAPNPHRTMGIDHVIVVGKSADQQRLVVLSVDALVKNPALMQTYGSEYKWATVFWNLVGAIMFPAASHFRFSGTGGHSSRASLWPSRSSRRPGEARLTS